MAIIPVWLQDAAAWVVWHLLGGEPLSEIEQEWTERFAGFPEGSFGAALGIAEQGIQAAQQAWAADPSTTVADAVLGAGEPAATWEFVARAHVRYGDGSEGYWMIRSTFASSESMAQVYGSFGLTAAQMAGDSRAELLDIELVPPVTPMS